MTVELGITLFHIAFAIYIAATVCYVAHLIKSKGSFGKIGTALLIAGVVLHAFALLSRGIALGRAPFLSTYEYMFSLTWVTMLVYLVVERTVKNRSIGAFIVPLTTLFVLFTVLLMPSDVNPTLPALRSAWRIPHITTAVLAYAAFILAFGLAVMYLIREWSGDKKSFWTSKLPSADLLDRLIYRAIAFGFMMQTAMILSGAIWAQIAWGRYWGWDPKETWALITWLIYAAYLHTRTTMGWRGHRSAMLAIVGLVVTAFTLFGVNYLLSGLHSYG